MPLVGALDGVERHPVIEGRQRALVGNRQRQQMGVGDLAVLKDAGPVDHIVGSQAQVVRPEPVAPIAAHELQLPTHGLEANRRTPAVAGQADRFRRP